MNEYYFLYKNSLDKWNTATNPVFIAKHTYCRAVSKGEFDSLNIGSLFDFLHILNSIDKIEDTKLISFINSFELY